MGMGKTVQILALLQSTMDKWEFPNLLVLPAAAILQWKGEIAKFCDSRMDVSVILSGKEIEKKLKENASVYLITYQQLEYVYRTEMSKGKQKCPYCSRKYFQN